MTDPRHPVTRQPQHVWVDFTTEFGAHRCPGILLEWRQVQVKAATKWQALVSFAVADAHGWGMRTEWVLAEHVRPAHDG